MESVDTQSFGRCWFFCVICAVPVRNIQICQIRVNLVQFVQTDSIFSSVQNVFANNNGCYIVQTNRVVAKHFKCSLCARARENDKLK